MRTFEIVTDPNDDDSRHSKCPHCQSEDSIVERDASIRWNTLTLSDDLTATADMGDEGDYERTGFLCTFCLEYVDAPEGFEIVDYR